MKPKNISFDTMRAANTARLPIFKNANGVQYHAPDGSDWSLAEWVNATAGEGGELCELVLPLAIMTTLGRVANIAKKVKRGDYSPESVQPLVAAELADVVLYCDLLAHRWGIDLGESVMIKFNAVSSRIGCDIMMDEHGVYIATRVKCDGNHGGAVCADKECWLRESDPFKELGYGGRAP